MSNETPIEVAFSGGGLRAVKSSAIFRQAMEECGLWGRVKRVAGISGGGWFVGMGMPSSPELEAGWAPQHLSDASEALLGATAGDATEIGNQAIAALTFAFTGANDALRFGTRNAGFVYESIDKATNSLLSIGGNPQNITPERLYCFEAWFKKKWVPADINLTTMRLFSELEVAEELELPVALEVFNMLNVAVFSRQFTLAALLVLIGSAHQMLSPERIFIVFRNGYRMEVRDAGILGANIDSLGRKNFAAVSHAKNIPLRNLLAGGAGFRIIFCLDNGSCPRGDNPLSLFSRFTLVFAHTNGSQVQRTIISNSAAIFFINGIVVVYFSGDNNSDVTSALSPKVNCTEADLLSQYKEDIMAVKQYLPN